MLACPASPQTVPATFYHLFRRVHHPVHLKFFRPHPHIGQKGRHNVFPEFSVQNQRFVVAEIQPGQSPSHSEFRNRPRPALKNHVRLSHFQKFQGSSPGNCSVFISSSILLRLIPAFKIGHVFGIKGHPDHLPLPLLAPSVVARITPGPPPLATIYPSLASALPTP